MQTMLSFFNPMQTPLCDTLKSLTSATTTLQVSREAHKKQQGKQNEAWQERIPALNLNLSFLNLR